ncbi:hypothetical protein [Nocardia xishanensis]
MLYCATDAPAARFSGVEREIWLLADHREELVAERIRAITPLRCHLHDLDPGWTPPADSNEQARAIASPPTCPSSKASSLG